MNHATLEQGPVLLILIDGDRCRTYQINEKDREHWAKYWYLRRIEKESFYADQAYLVDPNSCLPLEQWLEEDQKEQQRLFEKETEREERELYAKLKKKYEEKE